MGRKKLLRKCENKVSDMNVVTSSVVKVKLYLFFIMRCVGGVEMLSVCTSWQHAWAIFHSRQLLPHFNGLGWLQRSQSGCGDSSMLLTLLKVTDAPVESYYHDNGAMFLYPICCINSINSERGIHGISKVIHYKLQHLTLGEPESSLTGKRCSSKDGPLIIENFLMVGGGFCDRLYVCVQRVILVAMNRE